MQNLGLNLNFNQMKYFILALGVLVLGACSSIPSLSKKDTTMTLEDSQWILDDSSLSPNNEITLSIEGSRIFGNASCNNYFGEFTSDNIQHTFAIKGVGVTRKMCHKMSAEKYFLKMLDKVNKYKFNKGNLELYQDNILLLKFKKK